jgi:ATP phosphoribosyltransferase regulatory subunit
LIILAALDDLEAVVARVRQVCPSVSIYVDLTELRGFRYHTGLVFAVYVEGRGSSVAKGGRYDNIGAVFGRDRPATGFAIDLKALIDAIAPPSPEQSPIVAPRSEDPALLAKMTALREEGRIVMVDLESNTQLIGVESLVNQAGEWVVVAANEVSE